MLNVSAVEAKEKRRHDEDDDENKGATFHARRARKMPDLGKCGARMWDAMEEAHEHRASSPVLLSNMNGAHEKTGRGRKRALAPGQVHVTPVAASRP